MIVIDCNGLSLLIFEEKWPSYASGPIFAPNSDSFWVRRLFNVCVRVSCAPNATILLVYIPAKIKMSFIWKDDFFLPKSASSVSRSQAHLAKRKRRKPIEWTLYGVIMQNSSQWYLRNVQLLSMTVNWCWWCFTYTFCHSSNILGCTHCFWLFTLWLIDDDASFFHFFHKITNIRSWRCFSSYKINYRVRQKNFFLFWKML